MQPEFEQWENPENRGFERERVEPRGRGPSRREQYEGRGYGDYRGERRGGYEYEEPEHGGRWEGRSGQRDIGQQPPRGEYGPSEAGYDQPRAWEFRGNPRRGSYQYQQERGYSNIFDEEERSRRMRRSKTPPHSLRGTGPKGYSRSDDRILEDVSEFLTDAEIDVSEVSVEVADGLVTLSGAIDGRWAKRYAEDLAYTVRGVRDVRNLLRIDASVMDTSATDTSARQAQPSTREQGDGQRRSRPSTSTPEVQRRSGP